MSTGLVAALDVPLVSDPGTRWEYGIGIDWVGQVVEAVAGQTLGRYLAEHIFGAAGDGGYGVSGRRRASGMVSMHIREGAGLQLGSSGRLAKPELEAGGGGLYSTGPDYLRFLAALLRGGGGMLAAGDGGADGAEPDRRAGPWTRMETYPAGCVEPGGAVPGDGQENGAMAS